MRPLTKRLSYVLINVYVKGLINIPLLYVLYSYSIPLIILFRLY